MPYINPEAVEKAKRVGLLEYLQQHEPGNLVKLSGNNYCTKDHSSLKISNGKWYWFSRGIGGYNALDYLTKVEELSFIQALQILSGETFERSYDYEKPIEKEERVLQIPELSENTTRVKQYLMKRGIDPEIIDYGIRNALIFETERYHNALFVGYDSGGIARYGAVRSTFTNYKGDITGSDKRFSFETEKYHNALFVGYDPGGIARYGAVRSTFTNYKGDVTGSDKRFSFSFSGGPELHLFEAAIDLLSYASILKMEGKDWEQDSYLSLAGVSAAGNNKVPAALSQYLKDHDNIKTICFHLDNDEVGRGATASIMSALSGKYELIDEPPESGKDVNEALMNRIHNRKKKEEMTR